jgi:hypothetical protein
MEKDKIIDILFYSLIVWALLNIIVNAIDATNKEFKKKRL